MKKSRTRRFHWGLLALMALFLAAVMSYLLLLAGAFNKDVSVYVTPKTTYEDVAKQVKPYMRTGIHRKCFDICASVVGLNSKLNVGHYRFSKGTGVAKVVRRMVLGMQSPVRLVVRGARTLPQLAGRLSKQIAADSVTMLKTLRNAELCKELGYVNDSIIAMFVPNTYEVYWDTTPEKLMQRMKREYDAFWNEARIEKLQRCKLTKYQVMTLAAIVYEESKKYDEMPTIAGVYINRLRINMKLQADPTVKYAIGDFALRRILHSHLKYDSPFNTYIYKGLPPAPICIPSIAAIDAVLDYKEHDYLYFCARAELDGRHNFARTYEEHNENARKYSEALNELKIK